MGQTTRSDIASPGDYVRDNCNGSVYFRDPSTFVELPSIQVGDDLNGDLAYRRLVLRCALAYSNAIPSSALAKMRTPTPRSPRRMPPAPAPVLGAVKRLGATVADGGIGSMEPRAVSKTVGREDGVEVVVPMSGVGVMVIGVREAAAVGGVGVLVGVCAPAR